MRRAIYSFLFFLIFGISSCKINIEKQQDIFRSNKEITVSKNLIIKSEQKISSNSDREEAKKLNEQAVVIISEMNDDKYYEAIALLDEAIDKDSTFSIAYSNKASVLIRLKKYNEAIFILEYLVTNVKPEYPEALSLLGLLYDKNGDNGQAKKYYLLSIKEYSKRIKNKNNIFDMVNRAHITYILNSPQGLREIDSIINAYPESTVLPLLKESLFIEYDHKLAIDNL